MIAYVKPTKIQIYVNSSKKTLAAIKSETGADYIMNGGLYNMSTWKPVCHLKAAGKVLSSDQYSYWGYGWNDASDIAMVNSYGNYDNYICCSALVKDGKATSLYYNADLGGSRGRSAMGLMPDGRLVLYCVKDGTSEQCTPQELQKKMIALGVQSAIMLDGGGSSQCNFNGQTITSSRIVHNYILIWTGETSNFTLPSLTRVLYRKTPMMSGSDVLALQNALNTLGYSCGTADGWFGDKTDTAVRVFQAANKLVVDGKVGSATWAALCS